MLQLAIIGLGKRATNMLRTMLRVSETLELAAVADPDVAGVKERLAREGIDASRVRLFENAEALLEHADDFDGMLIGTRCHLHTPMAVRVAATDKPLFLEKPVAITHEQLQELAEAFQGQMTRVLVSFPLRVSPLFQAAREVVQSGRLGTINQVQAFNNVSYGGVYFGRWYRNYGQAGGLWMQKATHDLDYITQLVGCRPAFVAATATRRVYGGDLPHDLTCSACDFIETCPESSLNQRARGDSAGMSAGTGDDWDHWCCFSREIQNQDAGSALLTYEDGTHAVYSQNFVARRKTAGRGATIIGFEGSLRFDWQTEQMTIASHMQDRVDQVTLKASTGHGGGDHVLARNFIQMMRGEAGPLASLEDGILSAAMCLAARDASQRREVIPVDVPGRKRQTHLPLAIGG